ncbi:Uncharacterized protein Fot_27978 [Forsythia ovata]|uniref:Uncharacterized protein n=1 Tax=Forsythia ovata TaxID=205694 RepID=A0ABD1TMP8_9LAMI
MKRKRDNVKKLSKAKKKSNVGDDDFEKQPYEQKELSTHTTNSAKAAKGKRERCWHFNEEITNRLADIQSTQHELASDHVELKLEMIGLRHFVADMFVDLMDEIKKRNTENYPKPSDLQMVVYNGGVDSERKVDGDKNVDRPRYRENDIHGESLITSSYELSKKELLISNIKGNIQKQVQVEDKFKSKEEDGAIG